jgi:hypothetical protein
VVYYRFLLANLLTNQVTAELDLTGVSFTQQLNSAGSLSASLLLSGTPDPASALSATIPGRSAIYVDRNGVIVWGGIIWHRTYNSANQHIQLTASEFESYFDRRRITQITPFFNADPLVVARQLVSNAQSVPYGNIGVTVGNETSTMTPIARVYSPYEQKTVLSALQDLAKAGTTASGASSGFDFAITCSYDGSGNIVKTLKLGWPRLGTAYSSSSTTVPVFEFPAGNVVEYEYPEDGSLVANTMYATGAGSNEGKLIYSASDTTKFASGWPLLESSVSYSDVNDANLIQQLAAGQVAAVSYPPVVLKVVANPSTDPVFGSYTVGDDARIRIVDSRFPAGLDTTYRITGLTLTPGETGPERVTLTLSLPTA